MENGKWKIVRRRPSAMSLFAAAPLLPLFALLALPVRAQVGSVSHRCARIEDLCQQMEALAPDLKTKEAQESAAKLEEQFEKLTAFRAKDPAWPGRVKACRAWWEANRRSSTDADVPAAIDAGVRFLKSRQQKDGSWAYCLCGAPDWSARRHVLGTTALAVYTLLKCGVPFEDKSVFDGLNYILSVPIDKTADSPDVPTYTLSCVAMALSEALQAQKGRKGDHKTVVRDGRFRALALPRLAECANWLIKAQVRTQLTPPVLGRWYYSKTPEAWDNSCTQFAVLGLLAARNAGVVIPPDTWHAALNHWRATQLKDGSWSYAMTKGQEDKAPPSHSMTAAGVASLLICKASLSGIDTRKAVEKDKEVAAACAWLEKVGNTGLRPTRKGVGQSHAAFFTYYTLYAVERAMMLAGREQWLGSWDWYHDGALYLLFDQHPDGSWMDAPDTCLALLFLKRAYMTVKSRRTEPPPPAPPVTQAPPPGPAPKGTDSSADVSAEARRAKAEGSPAGPDPKEAKAEAPPPPPAPAQPPEKGAPDGGPGKPEEVSEVSVLLGSEPQAKGLALVPHEDGLYEAAEREGKPCVKTLRSKLVPEGHLYFNVADTLSWKSQAVDVTVEYFDGTTGQFRVQYDSTDAGATMEGVFKATDPVALSGTNAWKTTTFRLSDPAFRNRQQGRFDFRIETGAEELHVHRVTVVRCAPAPQASEARPAGLAPQGADPSADLSRRSPEGAKAETPPPAPPAEKPPAPAPKGDDPPPKPGQ